MDLFDHGILSGKDRRKRQAPQGSSGHGAHLTLLDLSSGSSCPFHGKDDGAGRSSAPAVKLDASTGHRRPSTSFPYNLHSSRNPSGNMANHSRGKCGTKTPSLSLGYGWAEPGEGWTRCPRSRSRSRSKSLHLPDPARQIPEEPESALEVRQRHGSLSELQGLPRALVSPPTSASHDCTVNNKESCRSRATVRPTEAPLEDISLEKLQEPSRPRKKSETRASTGISREQGCDATVQQDEVQPCQETERASRVQKYPVSIQRWYARLKEARNIKHALDKALSYNKGLRENNSEMAEMVGVLRRKVENLLPSASSSSLSQSTRESTSGSRENVLAQVQGGMDSTGTEESRWQNEKRSILPIGEECSEAASWRDSLEDTEEVTDAKDDRRPSAMPAGRRLQATGACTDGAIYCARLEKAAATDIAVSDGNQSHGLKSTSRPEEKNAYVDDTASSGACIRPLATDTKGEEGFRGEKFEPLETVSATITEVEAEKGTDSHGSDLRQETATRRVDVSPVAKPLNKCETISPTSWDRKEKIFDTRSRPSMSTRALAHSDEDTDTGDRCGSFQSRKANSSIVEKITRASQTPRPESQRIGSSWSLQTFAVDRDDIEAFSLLSVTGKRTNSAEEVIATPEPEGSVHGGTSQERHGDASKSPPIEDTPDEVDDQVKNLQRELYSTRRSLAAFKMLFFFSRQLSFAMDDRDLGSSRAFARSRHQNCVTAARKETPIRLPRSPYQATRSRNMGELQQTLNISGGMLNTEECLAERARQAARNMGVRRSTTPTQMPPMPPIPPSSRMYRSASSVINNTPPQAVEDTQKAHIVLHSTKQEEDAREIEVYQFSVSEGAAAGAREQSKIVHDQVRHQIRGPIVSTINEKGGRYVREEEGASESYRFEVGLTEVDEASPQNDEHQQVNGIGSDDKHVGRQWGFGSHQQNDWRSEGGWTGEAENEEDGEMGDEEVNGDGWEMEEGTKAPEEGERGEGEENEEQARMETATDEFREEGYSIDDDEAKRILLYRRDCAMLAGTTKIVLVLAALGHRRISSRFYRWKRVHRYYADDQRARTSLRIKQVGPKRIFC